MYVVKGWIVLTGCDNFLLLTSSLSRALQTVCPVEFLKFCRQIVAGMVYLSQKGFVHRDLAARNILLDSANNCKVRSRVSVVCSHLTVASASANIALFFSHLKLLILECLAI